MAVYAIPTGAQIRAWTRLEGAAFGITNPELEAQLAAAVALGEAEVFDERDELKVDATLGTSRALNLGRAVAHATARLWLWEIWQDVVAGTYEPLLNADPESIKALVDANAAEVDRLAPGGTSDTGPYSRPRAMSSAFWPAAEPIPSDRIEDGDIRDDLPANQI